MAEVEGGERFFEGFEGLSEVGPAFEVDGNDGGLGEGGGGVEDVIGVHCEVEGATGGGGSGKYEDVGGLEFSGNFGCSFIKDGIPGDVKLLIVVADDKAGDVACQLFDACGSVPGGCGGNCYFFPFAYFDSGAFPGLKAFGAAL